MKYIRLLSLILLLLFRIADLKAQPGPVSESISRQMDYAATPKALACVEYGALTPDLNTGALSFDIPIYTYEDQDFTIPVSLRYFTNGFRPERPSEEAGLGWTLMAGGAISREIVGVDDFGDYGRWGYNLSNVDVYNLNGSVYYHNAAGEDIISMTSDGRETTSDIYHFTFPGHSGSFVIRSDGAGFKVYGCSGGNSGTYTVTMSGSGTDTYLTITTGDGSQWRFGYDPNARERLSRSNGITEMAGHMEYESQMPVVTWLLDRITAPDGRMAEFAYIRGVAGNSIPTDGTDVSTTFGRGWNVREAGEGITQQTFYKTASLVYTSFLSAIKVSSPSGPLQTIASVDWSYKPVREVKDTDEFHYRKMVVRGRKLDRIDIYAGAQVIRSASLNYTYCGLRPLLTGVSVSGVGDWEMTYNLPPTGGLPGQLTNATDFWGFYNGKEGTSDSSIAPTTINTTTFDETLPANRTYRDPDAAYSVLGTLASITWPTGGTTTIGWEANRASGIVLRRSNTPATPIPAADSPGSASPFIGALYPISTILHSDEAGGVRVASISEDDGVGPVSIRTYTYARADSSSSGIIQRFNRFYAGKTGGLDCYNPFLKYPGSSFDGTHIAYASVTETLPDGSSIRTDFSSWEDTPDGYSPNNAEYYGGPTGGPDPSWSQTYRNFINNILREPDSRAYRRGLPLRRTVKGPDGHVVEDMQTTYTDASADSVYYVVGSGERWWSAKRVLCDRVPASVTRRFYPANDSSALVSTTSYGYDDCGRTVNETVAGWDGTEQRIQTVWLSESESTAPGLLPLSVTRSARKVSSGTFSLTSREEYTWEQSAAGSPLWNLSQHQTRLFWPSGSSSVSQSTLYSAYDTCGNPRQVSYADGRTEAWVWGWGGRYPVARVVGKSWDALPDAVQGTLADNLSSAHESALYALSDALVDTWSWRNNMGLIRTTDPARRERTYSYDSYGRLIGESDALGSLYTWTYGTENKGSILLKTQDQVTLNGDRPLTERTLWDGLGREWMHILRKGEGTAMDKGVFVYRDEMGRESRTYLPFAASDITAASASSQQVQHWRLAASFPEGPYAFGIRTYTGGSLSLLESETLPGKDFHIGGIKTQYSYGVNAQGEVPAILYNESDKSITVGGHYAPGTLLRAQAVTADGETTVRFTDLSGNTVLERRIATEGNATEFLDTYYVRDLAERVVWVLSPGIGNIIRTAASGQGLTLSIADDLARDWCHIFTYNRVGEVAAAYTPGAGKRSQEHNGRHQLILERSPLLDSKEYYIRHTYDSYERPTGTKLYKFRVSPDLVSGSRENGLASIVIEPPMIEVDTLIHDLSSIVYATASGTPYTDIPAELAFRAVADVVMEEDISQNICGEPILKTEWLLTGPYTEESITPTPLHRQGRGDGDGVNGSAKVIIHPLGNRAGVSDSFVRTAYYYDALGRVVQEVRRQPDGGISRFSYAYDRVGNVLASAEEHAPKSGSSSADWTITENGYDNRGDLLFSTLWAGRGTVPDKSAADLVSASAHVYDGTGRVMRDTLRHGSHSVLNSYAYSLQGWPSVRVAHVDGNEVFRQTLSYSDASPNAGLNRYNGDISQITFLEGGNAFTQLYSYDGFGRLDGTLSYLGLSAPQTSGLYESGYTYDPAGNLLSLSRYGLSGVLSAGLSFTRDAGRLSAVSDSVSDRTWTYSYAPGGLLAYDGRLDKTIEWNILEQVQSVGGRKRSVFADGGGLYEESYDTDKRQHLGNATYRKSGNIVSVNYQLLSFDIPGGKVINNGGLLRTLTPYAHITDHLGSIRAVVDLSTGSVVERNNYYAYGTKTTMAPDGSAYPQLSSQTFGFGGKEEQDATLQADYLDFGARLYDPIVASWLAPDPLAHDYPGLGPWSYCAANPVNLVDPDGRHTKVIDNGNGTYEVIGGELDDDLNIYEYYPDKNGEYTQRGKSIGKTTSLTSFYNTDAEEGEDPWVKATISLNDMSGKDFIDYIADANLSLYGYAINALPNGILDFKKTNGTFAVIYKEIIDIYRGMPIGRDSNGILIISSARDIGNIVAGYEAGLYGIPWRITRKAFDFLERMTSNHNKEGDSSQNAQKYGWEIGFSKRRNRIK